MSIRYRDRPPDPVPRADLAQPCGLALDDTGRAAGIERPDPNLAPIPPKKELR
jgi:hypothetical protein